MLLVFAKYGVLVNPLGIPVVEYEQVSIIVGEGHHGSCLPWIKHQPCTVLEECGLVEWLGKDVHDGWVIPANTHTRGFLHVLYTELPSLKLVNTKVG